MWYTLTWPIACGILRIAFRILGGGIHRNGTENVPKTGGVLICPNHVCDADAGAIAVAVPRAPWFIGKAELFSPAWFGALLHHFHVIPIKRDSADRSALRRADALLKAGEALVLFPEGGGNPEGVLQPLHPGAAMIALRAHVPIVPVALINTNKIWPYGDPRPRRGGVPVRVIFGEPIDLSDLEGQKGAIEAGTARLTERLAALVGQPIPTGKPQKHEEAPKAEMTCKPVPPRRDAAIRSEKARGEVHGM